MDGRFTPSCHPLSKDHRGPGTRKGQAGKAPTARGVNSRGQQEEGEEMVVHPSAKGFGQDERGSLQPLPRSSKEPGFQDCSIQQSYHLEWKGR